MNRPVKVTRYSNGEPYTIPGTLLAFVIDFEELCNGIGHYTIGIVKYEEDGQLDAVPIQNIKLL